MKIKDYLEESKVSPETKKLQQKLDGTIANAIINTIDDFMKKEIDQVKGFDYNGQRDEILLYAAEGATQMLNGMIKAAKQNLKRIK